MIVAVSGGIGSGKSVVMSILEKLGAYVLYCDKINAELLLSPDYVEGLNRIFPGSVHDGKVNKKILRELIFRSEDARKMLNDYSHDAIFAEISKRIGKSGNTFVEIPLLAESGKPNYFDKIWLVTAPTDVRVERVCVRDNATPEMVKKIIESQKAEKTLSSIANELIVNDGTVEALTEKVKKLYYAL